MFFFSACDCETQQDPKTTKFQLKRGLGGGGGLFWGGVGEGGLKKEEMGRGGGAFSRGRLVWNHGQGGGRLLTGGPPS